MSKSPVKHLKVKDTEIRVIKSNDDDYICLTDMARSRSDRMEITIQNWMRGRQTIEFLGLWESMNNPVFKHIEFDVFRGEAGLNAFVLSPSKWISKTGAIGIVTKKGKHDGGTFAHKDIAFEFGTWLSPEFKLYLIKEFQRLKDEESKSQNLDWNLSRFLAKANYRIQTDAIKDNLIPTMRLPKEKEGLVYASEADMLNLAVFGMTARQWDVVDSAKAKSEQRKAKSIRDGANIIQLTVLSNLESLNAGLIDKGISQEKRFEELRGVASTQYERLQKSAQLGKKNVPSLFGKSEPLLGGGEVIGNG